MGRISPLKLAATIAAVALASAPSPRVTAHDAVPVDVAAVPLDTTSAADAILGKWWSEGREGLMQFEKTVSGRFQVRVIDGKDVNDKDINNPDPKLRERKLKNVVLMWNLRYEDGEYVDGYCYNPRDGNTYRVKFKLLSATRLRLRGYLAVPLLGQSQEWTRAA
jgi:uncharacterized protein (DUF2147 family)